MAYTEAQLAANRNNAKKSTGPRTEAGKARSCQNAVRHGLSGAGVALPADLRAEVAQLESEFTEEFQPTSAAGRADVAVLALSAGRRLRCARMEIELTARNRVRDLECYVDDRVREARELGSRLADDPARVAHDLLATAAGCDWLVERWRMLAEGLSEGRCVWSEEDLQRALDLLGVYPEERHLDPWAHDYRMLWELAAMSEPTTTEAEAACAELLGRVNEEIEVLARRSERLFEAVDAPEIAALEADLRFDVSPRVRYLRRLEGVADRRFERALRRLDERRAAEVKPCRCGSEPCQPVAARPLLADALPPAFAPGKAEEARDEAHGWVKTPIGWFKPDALPEPMRRWLAASEAARAAGKNEPIPAARPDTSSFVPPTILMPPFVDARPRAVATPAGLVCGAAL